MCGCGPSPFNHQKLLSAAKKGRQAVEEDLEIDKVGRPPVCDAGRSGDGYLTSPGRDRSSNI